MKKIYNIKYIIPFIFIILYVTNKNYIVLNLLLAQNTKLYFCIIWAFKKISFNKIGIIQNTICMILVILDHFFINLLSKHIIYGLYSNLIYLFIY